MTESHLPVPVLSAVKRGDLTELRSIYEPSVSIDDIAKEAARHSQPRILEWCYTRGWMHPAKGSLNEDFLTMAADGASIDIYQVLVDHGFDTNKHYTEACGDNIAMAISGGKPELVRWLLEHGHDATPKDGCHGEGSVVYAICEHEEKGVEILRLLLAHGMELKGTGYGVAAADKGNLGALESLLDHGVDLEDRGMLGYPFDDERDEPKESQGTALYRACRQGHVECARLLLDRGANSRARDEGGTSCIDIAKRRGHEDVVQLLERRGVLP
jgi:hypothetical protein